MITIFRGPLNDLLSGSDEVNERGDQGKDLPAPGIIRSDDVAAVGLNHLPPPSLNMARATRRRCRGKKRRRHGG